MVNDDGYDLIFSTSAILVIAHCSYCARYAEGEECPEEMVIHFTVAQWSSNTVRDCITRFGARIIEVKHSLSKCHGFFALNVELSMTQDLALTMTL